MRATLLLGMGGMLFAAPAVAAAPTVRVGTIASEKSCSLYQMEAGHHAEAAAANARGAVYASETSWTTYLVRDCADNFASLRTSLQAALAASGKLAVVPGTSGGAYVVSGRISDVGWGSPAISGQDVSGGAYAVSSANLFVNMDVTLRDSSGRIVYGGLLTKSLETGSSMQTEGLSTGSGRSGQALYTSLQHEVALAVARIVAFRIAPLRVTSVSGQQIQLNYGAPLVQLGAMVQVTGPDGSIVRYRVSGAGQGSAQADYYGGGAAASVAPGSMATVIEGDDPAANARRFEKVDLP